MRLFLYCWLCVLMTAILAAQTPTPTKEPPTSALEGQVVRDPGSLPVKKAEVQVIAEGQEEEGKTYTGTTDADGHFRIEGIHAGRYRAFVERVGLVEIDKRHKRSAGTALSFDPGKDISDLVLHMLSAAVVVGRVVDEDGDPMPRTDVSVLRYGYALGERHLETAASGTTNDLGEYRIPDLLPGHYLIAANPTPDFSNLAATPADKPNGQPKQEMAYVPTYYPGTTDPSQAGFLELRAGDETAVNFNLILTPTFHVRGSVGGAQNLGSSVELVVRAKDQQSEFTATELDKDGNFDISHLAPGSYTLFAVREGHDTSLLAQQAIEISNRDIDGLRMLALGGSRVRGSVSVEGVHRIDPSRLLFFLRPSEIEKGGSFIGDLAAAQTLAPVQADGAFELKDVPAGSYSILVEGTTLLPDYYLKSAKLGSTDVLDAGLSLGGGGSYALEILIGAGAATLDGQVDRDGQPFADATVLAVPSGEHASRLQLYEKTATDQHGHFALKGLTPGDYRLFAFESIEEGVYFDPAFLKPYEGSSEIVHLAENAHKTLQLKLIPAGDDAP